MALKKRLYDAFQKNLHTRRLIYLLKIAKRVMRKGSYYSRSFFYLPEKKVLYLSVSKAGNTSIKASMFAIPHAANYRAIHQKVHTLHRSAGLGQIDDFADYYKFTFVRNPFHRLVSCYENKLHTDVDQLGNGIRFLIYDAYLMGFLSKDRGFKNFARRVCMIPDRIADRHFVSQSMGALTSDGKLVVDFFGKLERMEKDYEPLRQRFGFAPLPHYNKTRRSGKSWMDYYDLDTARRVYKRYRTDIEVFGYQDAYDKLIAYLEAKGNA